MKVKSLNCVRLFAHGLQPTRLLRPWDFPGKSTGVGCHCLLCWEALTCLNFPNLGENKRHPGHKTDCPKNIHTETKYNEKSKTERKTIFQVIKKEKQSVTYKETPKRLLDHSLTKALQFKREWYDIF